ncbi:Ribosome biogenesis protein 15 [Nakaseomyces bracarensis]|uniref:Ribosome biogenesis protein 15 n=1 Tax=Nakaseomyces bracarensis TaxID=273131 RepID=A0ABR4NUT2_9SACH
MAVTKRQSKKEDKKVEEKTEDVMAVESGESDESGLESELDVEGSDSDSEIEGMEASESGKHHIKKLDIKKKDQKVSNKKDAKEAISGIIYVGRLPRGFHEKELSKYFSQFGDLKEVRLARNKKTGNSRHYGFVQFVNPDDSLVAHETMNNYLLMGHLIQVRLLPKGSKIEKLYKYKQRAFSAPPKAKKSAKELKENAEKKHEERMEKLKNAGINFEY